ncbi:MAG: undecaprenyl-diphosphate phosphatase [Alistipes sp.]|jgi:undecaprenyl-diphosphatase|nr:undecaprenyl-diphosphate phosphatase [Alistipes sp.]
MSVLEAIILGVVQGAAEFLPVSSSGHLQIAKEALGVTLTDNLAFDMALHLATVLATVVVLWREVAELFTGLGRGLTKRQYNPQVAYILKLVLSMVPVALVGLLLRDELNAMLSSPHILLVVGAMLIATAGLLMFASRADKTGKTGKTSEADETDGACRAHEVKSGPKGEIPYRGEISYRDAFIIGIGQAFAAMPGLSRSGTTIATGLLLGNKKAAVARFSFLMIIAPIVGEALLDIARGGFGGGIGVGMVPLAAGFAAAFAVGCLACKFMIEMVKRSKLVWFAAYCAVVGVATVVYYFV